MDDGSERSEQPRLKRHEQLLAAGKRRQEQLEGHRFVAFPLEAFRRFGEIEGKTLSLVIAVNAFIAIIPLFIVSYAMLEAFNPDRSFGVVLAQRFHLSGDTAKTVHDTFASAESGKNVALSIGLISLLITGFDVAAAVQLAYARAFRMTPLKGVQKYGRGALWLVSLLFLTGLGMTLRYWATSRPLWFLLLMAPLLVGAQFVFWLITPRLVLDLPFKWRDLVPGAAFCTVAALIVNGVTVFLMRNWLSFYGHAYGGFGIALAMMSYVTIIAAFWVWIATVMGVYWQQRVGTAGVEAMEEISAHAA